MSGRSSLSDSLITMMSILSQGGHLGLIPAKAFQPLKRALAVSSLSLWIFNHTKENPLVWRILPRWEVRLDTQVGMLRPIAVCPRMPALGIPGKHVKL